MLFYYVVLFWNSNTLKLYLFSILKLDLFEIANIKFETSMRVNQTVHKQTYNFRKSGKGIETKFSQLWNQFTDKRIYTKSFQDFKQGF